MKKMLSLVLALTMLCSLMCPIARAAEEDTQKLEDAIRVVTDSLAEARQILPEQETVNSLTAIFNDFCSAAKTTGTVLGVINGSVSFLKLIGVVKDPNAEAFANIQTQLQAISEQLTAVEEQLTNITTQMAQVQASVEFNARAEKALALQSSWNDFKYRYVEAGMDDLMTQYNSMLLNGMQRWCLNKTADARTADSADLSQIVLHYTPADGEYKLVYTDGNENPADFAPEDRYLVLTPDFLPSSLSWNVNSYRAVIADCIAEKIREYAQAGNYAAFECGGFPAFTEEGAAELTDELIRQVSEDAVNALVYAVTAAEVNKDSAFSLQVERQFNNYCQHLLASEEGMDAVFRVFYLTHAFEYQISDALLLFCSEMAIKTGVYGSFAANVLGMSSFITEKQKTDMLDSYCNTLIAIGQAKENCLKGYDNYCYVTNKLLYFGTVTFTNRMSLSTRELSSKRAYESFSASPAEISLDGDWKHGANPALIGDSDALLLTYTLQSNGESADLSKLGSALGSSAQNVGAVVTSVNSEQSLPLSSNVSMVLTNVIGSYFPTGATASLRNLPEKADSDYIRYRTMVTGSVINASGGLEVNKALEASAIYAEDHWYWEKDEAAFLGGGECEHGFLKSVDKKQTGLEFPATYHYRTDYTQYISYNCLAGVPLEKKFKGDQYSPLDAYVQMCETLGKPKRSSKPTQTVEVVKDETLDAPESKEIVFSDVPEDAYYSDAVHWATERGITEGTDTAHFSPDASCTRAQMVCFLWRAAGSPEVSSAETFRDVAAGSYYEKAVTWAAAEGITTGTPEREFRPEDVCTRSQMVAFLYRFAKAAPASSAISFADLVSGAYYYDEVARAADLSGGAYYYDAVAWAYANSITKGTSDTTFSPDAECTRAQAVTLLHRYMVR